MLFRFKKCLPGISLLSPFRPAYLLRKKKKSVLVQAFQEGENWAFEKIYSQYQKRVLRFVSQKIKNQEAAQDITQEIFLKVYRFRENYQPELPFQSWLWTISRNTVFDWLRKNKSENSIDISTHEGETRIEEQLPSPHPNAEALLEEISDRQLLNKMLGRLTELQRKVICMRLIQQLSYQEIAKNLGLSLSAVKCLMYRSKRFLAEAGYAVAFT